MLPPRDQNGTNGQPRTTRTTAARQRWSERVSPHRPGTAHARPPVHPVAPGERGEIICTGLYNLAMPLIRYRIGDVGVSANELCSCGRGLALIKAIEGRSEDFVKTPAGRIISPVTLCNLLLDIEGITQFKITQEKLNALTIQVVKDKSCSPETTNVITEKIGSVLGENVLISTEVVDEIPLEESGKIRRVVSKVPLFYT